MLWRIVFWPNSGSHLHVNIRVSQSTWEFCPWRVRNWQPLPFLASRHTSTILITPFLLTISPLSRLCDLYLADSGVFVFTFCVLSMLWIYINISRTWFTVRYLIDCVISWNHFRHINIINDNIYIYILSINFKSSSNKIVFFSHGDLVLGQFWKTKHMHKDNSLCTSRMGSQGKYNDSLGKYVMHNMHVTSCAHAHNYNSHLFRRS